MTLHKVDFGDREYILSNVHDITQRKATDHKILQMARYDGLTGLANRGVFMEAVEQAIARAKRSGTSSACSSRPRPFQGRERHARPSDRRPALDRSPSGCRRARARSDIVARFGGDEFAMLATDIDDLSEPAVAEKILAALSQPFSSAQRGPQRREHRHRRLSAPTLSDGETLLAHADVALYRAKSEGRGTYRFFTDAMNEDVRRRVDARHRVARGDRGRSALSRLSAAGRCRDRPDHGGRGAGPLGASAARRSASGRVHPAGRKERPHRGARAFVLREACRQTRIWIDAGFAPTSISVNVSGVQFKSAIELEARYRRDPGETRVPARRLELELAEAALMDASREHTTRCCACGSGVRLAIDDFGTGYSSLDYLRAFRSTASRSRRNSSLDLTLGARQRRHRQAAIGLARELGIAVLAEGVETEAQLRLLRQWGCSSVQGFYFSKPLPAAAVEPLLRRGHIFPPLRLVS